MRGALNRFLSLILKPLFKKCGQNVRFDAFGYYSYTTISIGDNVFINKGAKFSASVSSITIGNNVIFGPNVTIRGGTHNISVIGSFMSDVHEKRPEDDQPVIIENDVWIGSCVTILKGVRIGRGAVIGAGALITKNIPPYSIAMGVPAKVTRTRFTFDQIIEHEKLLYPESKQLSRSQLIES